MPQRKECTLKLQKALDISSGELSMEDNNQYIKPKLNE
jgi:hypothetical protein